jgi:hypothetical protein
MARKPMAAKNVDLCFSSADSMSRLVSEIRVLSPYVSRGVLNEQRCSANGKNPESSVEVGKKGQRPKDSTKDPSIGTDDGRVLDV